MKVYRDLRISHKEMNASATPPWFFDAFLGVSIPICFPQLFLIETWLNEFDTTC